jgi:uncharacterized repeat protein (TIGR03803 family)
MTDNGGSNGNGAIFSFNPANNGETVLHSFGATAGDARSPRYGSLIQSGTALYGMTDGGGSDGEGAIFSFNAKNRVVNVLNSLGSRS